MLDPAGQRGEGDQTMKDADDERLQEMQEQIFLEAWVAEHDRFMAAFDEATEEDYYRRLEAWECSRKYDYPTDEWGYSFCVSCGHTVSMERFSEDGVDAHKDYCRVCAARESK